MRKLTISKLEKQGYQGIDASLSESLFVYGLAWKIDKENINFIFEVQILGGGFIVFDTAILTIDECNNFIVDNNWIKQKELFSCIDCLDIKTWDNYEPTFKIFELFSYYGYEKIFGFNYCTDYLIEIEDLFTNIPKVEEK